MEPESEIGTLHSINERRTVHPSQASGHLPLGRSELAEAPQQDAERAHALLVERLELAHQTTASLVRQLERADALGARALAADQRNVDLQRRLLATEAEAAELARHLDHLARDRDDMLGSTSWRITRPLRQVFTFLRWITRRPVTHTPR